MFWIVVAIVLVALAAAFYTFVLGVAAWRRARRADPGGSTLHQLALMLCEPLLSGLLALLLALTDLPWSRSGFWTAWWLSAPLLALPLFLYLRASDPPASRQRTRLFKLALARWGAIFAMFLCIFFNVGMLGAAFPTLPLLLCGLSAAILGYAAFSGRRALAHSSAAGSSI
jgi:hypothetical protein